MFILSGTIALNDGSILTGAAIKDGGLADIVTAGREIRYFGDVIHSANAGLADLVTAQDLVTRLYNDASSFRNLIAGFLANGIAGTANAAAPGADVSDVVFQFAAHLASNNYLYVAGSSHDEAPTFRSNDIAAAMAILDADGDFTALFSGVIT